MHAIAVSRHPLDRMVDKIASHVALDDDDRRALFELPHATRSAATGTCLIWEGETSQHYAVLLSGYACRYKITGEGGRQIVALQIPGEALSCCSLFFDRADHSTQALGEVEMVLIPREAFRTLARTRPAIGNALLLMTLVEASISNEWLLNLGRRPAKTRVAHFLCEFAARLDAADLSDGTSYELPMTQEQMGDALGLTAVHVNRMMRELRNAGLLLQSRRSFALPRRAELASVADFTADYLRIDQPRGVDAGG